MGLLDKCVHGVLLTAFCVQCEDAREQAQLEYERADPYECMPFGDAIRWEEEQIFNEQSHEADCDFESDQQEADLESDEPPPEW